METFKAQTREQAMQQKSIELQAMFNKNMSFFRNADPSIYEKYINYNPEKIRLIYTDDGHINLAHTEHNNQLVYNSDPALSAKERVEAYIQKPFSEFFYARATEVTDLEDEIHISTSNALIDYINAIPNDASDAPLGEHTEFMLVLGVGLGFHIQELLNKTHIRHLTIVETHEDIFFASLNTIDWEKIADHFAEEDTSLNLIIGQAPEDFSRMMLQHLNNIGIFNAAKPYIFKHLNSEKMQKITEEFFLNLGALTSTAGYYDDERIGLSHTINNFNNKIPFLKGHSFLKNSFKTFPVFLVANGPSLDESAKFIKENMHKAIIVSCGSSLSSLYKLGIKPDFHIEMERTRPPIELIETTTDAEFRKGVTVLALNTIHPDLAGLFDKIGLGLKMNDLGAEFIAAHLSKNEIFVRLGSSNPTVSNTGLAFCTAFGFSNIYLFGIDFGFASDGQHHASTSFHYDVDDSLLRIDTVEKHGTLKIDGNFGGKITTSDLYLRAKMSMEVLIEDAHKLTDYQCYNTGNGVSIKGTTPIKYHDIDASNWKELNKKDICGNIFNEYFTNQYSLTTLNEKIVTELFTPAKKIMAESYNILSNEFTDNTEVFRALMSIQQSLKVHTRGKELCYTLLRGSFLVFPLVLATSLYIKRDKEESMKIFNNAKKYFLSFLDRAQKDLTDNFIRNNQTKSDAVQLMKNKKHKIK